MSMDLNKTDHKYNDIWNRLRKFGSEKDTSVCVLNYRISTQKEIRSDC